MASQSGVEKKAMADSGVGSSQSLAAYNTLAPQYRQMVNNPQGFTPQQRSDLTTSTLDTAGGSTAGAVGQGALLANRTNNAGAATAAIDDAARTGATTATDAAMGIGIQNAQLARQQQTQGLAGMQDLYSGGNSASNAALGIANSNQQGNSLLHPLLSVAGQVGGAWAGK